MKVGKKKEDPKAGRHGFCFSLAKPPPGAAGPFWSGELEEVSPCQSLCSGKNRAAPWFRADAFGFWSARNPTAEKNWSFDDQFFYAVPPARPCRLRFFRGIQPLRSFGGPVCPPKGGAPRETRILWMKPGPVRANPRRKGGLPGPCARIPRLRENACLGPDEGRRMPPLVRRLGAFRGAERPEAVGGPAEPDPREAGPGLRPKGEGPAPGGGPHGGSPKAAAVRGGSPQGISARLILTP